VSGAALCRVDEIPDGGSNEILADLGGRQRSLMAIRRDGNVYVYVNSCPHIQMPLDFKRGQFLNVERNQILCTNHGALFRIRDGYCVFGPCKGENLTAVAVEVRDGMIYLNLAK